MNLDKNTLYKKYGESIISALVFGGYMFLSSYEVYVAEVFGQVSRYYILLMLAYLVFVKRFILIRWYHVTIAIWLGYYYVTLLWSPDREQASLYILTVTVMSVLFMLIAGIDFSEQFVHLCVTMSFLWSVSLGFLGLFYTDKLAESIESRRVLTLFGVQPDPNNLVALLAVGTSIAIYRLFFGDTKRIIYLVGLALNTYGILMCGSRSGIVVLTLQFGIALLLTEKDDTYKSKWKRKILIVIIAIGVVTVAFLYLPEAVIIRMTGQDKSLRFTDSTGRTKRWMDGVILWWNTNPVFGCGWGAKECHGTFFTFLVDTGIIGSGLFWGTVLGIAAKAIRKKNVLAILLMLSGIIPGLLIGAQNKRFFWNALIIPIMLLNACHMERSDIVYD